MRDRKELNLLGFVATLHVFFFQFYYHPIELVSHHFLRSVEIVKTLTGSGREIFSLCNSMISPLRTFSRLWLHKWSQRTL